jgi:maltose O-acetyltransferase
MSLAGRLARVRHRFLGHKDIAFYRSRGMVVGEDVQLGPDNYFDPPNAGLISIGDRVVFAPRVTIIAHDASLRRRKGLTKIACVTIGDDVFVGAGVMILPGVTIGAGAIIGAGSLVVRDVPAGTLAIGSPARPVKDVADLEAKYDRDVQSGPRYNTDTPGRVPTRDEWPAMRAEVAAAGYGWGA